MAHLLQFMDLHRCIIITESPELTLEFTHHCWHIPKLWRPYLHSLYEYLLKLGTYFDAHVDKIGLGFQESIFVCVLFLFWLCCKACRILVPRSGIEPETLAVRTRPPNHWIAREVLINIVRIKFIPAKLKLPLALKQIELNQINNNKLFHHGPSVVNGF